MTARPSMPADIKYPLAIRLLHVFRAVLILGLIASGLIMVGRAEDDALAAIMYPTHKQFGVLVWLLALVHIALRWHYRKTMPHPVETFAIWERRLAHGVHRLLIGLTLITPLMGYGMSISLPGGDGVPFLSLARLPEFLPKSDAAFSMFQALHKYSAYVLLACIVLHVAGTLKHRLMDRHGQSDVLARMF